MKKSRFRIGQRVVTTERTPFKSPGMYGVVTGIDTERYSWVCIYVRFSGRTESERYAEDYFYSTTEHANNYLKLVR